jgi:glucose repression regulatory protein TUP1
VLSATDGIMSVAISPDSKYIAAGSLKSSDNIGIVSVWNIATGDLVDKLEGRDGHKDSVFSVAFAPNGRYLVSGSLDKTIKMWEFAPLLDPNDTSKRSRYIKTFKGHKVNYLSSFCFLSIT